MQGTPQEALATRDGADRIYGFDVYNDLGKPADGPAKIRPTLGTATLPFPRQASVISTPVLCSHTLSQSLHCLMRKNAMMTV